MSAAVKRACDACHRRKVKCDGINPCRNCSTAQLGCTYNAIPQKKGPKGSRAKVISELRETQRQTSLSAKVQSRMSGVSSPPSTPSLAPSPGLLTSDLVKESIEFFFANMYSKMPILQRQRLEQQAMFTDNNLETYCLLSSLCAFMMFQPGMSIPGATNDPYNLDMQPQGANIVTGTMLLDETVRVRKNFDYLGTRSLNGLCTSYFLSSCYYALEMHDKAWFHLREATTMAHIIGMNTEETYVHYDNIDASRRRRLYWLLFVTERAYALRFQRPLTLQATINAPTLTDDPSDPLAHQLNGFLMLVNLFRPFDDLLVSLWNKTRGDCQQQYLTGLDKQYQETAAALMTTDPQFADSAKSQQWLKNLVWQINMASGNGNDMMYQYPMDVSNDVALMASSFGTAPQMNLRHVSLTEKLLAVTADLTDVLPLQPASRVSYIIGPRESLGQILTFLAVVRNGEHRFMPLLLSKVHEVLPRLVNPVLTNAPENTRNNLCNIDIFDGFGNAGMAQPPCMPMEEYDGKFSVAQDYKAESSPSGSAPSSNDLTSPYVSSPPLMTPGVDYPHGLPADFSSMSDMVLSPLGPGPNSSLGASAGMNAQQQQPLMSNLQALGGMGQPANINLNGSNLDQLGTGLNVGASGIPANGMMVRPQPPQRSNSFAVPPPAQIRTVGDFQALQRANSDINAMGSMGIEMDFNTLR